MASDSNLLKPAPLPAWIAVGLLGLASLGVLAQPPQAPPSPSMLAPREPPGVLATAGREPPPPVRTETRRERLTPTRPMRRKAQVLHSWFAQDYHDEGTGDPQTFQIDDVRLTFGSASTETDGKYTDKSGLMVLLTKPGMKPLRLEIEASAHSYFGVGRLDLDRPGPQVLIATYSGGAHCCTTYTLYAPKGRQWVGVELGAWDKSMDDWPQDRTGNGRPEFGFGDDAFNYAFAPYSNSWSTYRFFELRDGKMVDVSRHPAFLPLYRRYAAEAEKACREHDNGACAGFVAASARAGRFNRAWKVMLANYDREDDWSLPRGCKVAYVKGACPSGEIIEFDNFPDALRSFLKDTGYLPR